MDFAVKLVSAHVFLVGLFSPASTAAPRQSNFPFHKTCEVKDDKQFLILLGT